jgi:hypothetical protein
MTAAAVRLLSEGFLHPATTLENERTDDHRLLHVPVHDLETHFQFFHCRVEDAGTVVEYVVADSGSPASVDIVQRFLFARFPESVVLLLRSQATGRAVVECEPGSSLAFQAAAAVATIMYAAAWDESESIRVEGGGARHDVAVSFDEPVYRVRAIDAGE